MLSLTLSRDTFSLHHQRTKTSNTIVIARIQSFPYQIILVKGLVIDGKGRACHSQRSVLVINGSVLS